MNIFQLMNLKHTLILLYHVSDSNLIHTVNIK